VVEWFFFDEPLTSRSNARLRFIQRHAEKIIGMLNGWDRIRLRGTFRWLANVDGMESYFEAK
jgi:hypothetical protein